MKPKMILENIECREQLMRKTTPTYFELQPGTSLSFAQMTANQVISSNLQSSRSSFPSFEASTREIISSTVIENDDTLVDTIIVPKSMLLNKPKGVQEKEHKKEVENL